MNWMKKGPDLKLSEIKVPDFLHDLYYDLKERRLLPLVAVLLVAIVAAPIALGQSGSGSTEPEEEAAVATPSTISPNSETLVVAKSTPGLRDYRGRLKHTRALDPFEQQFDGSNEGEGAAAVASSGEPSAAEEPSIPLPSTEGTPAETTSGSETSEAKYASNSIDVRIVSVPTDGAAKSSGKTKPQVRRNVPELTMLPSRDTPAATFMGTSSNGKKALLLVSSDVESIFGDGQCIVGSKTCQLLALEEGLPETFVYGPQGRTYRIEILKIEKTLSAKPRRAALGAPKKKDQQEPGKPGPKNPSPKPKRPPAPGERHPK
jgi:hypothetical protein